MFAFPTLGFGVVAGSIESGGGSADTDGDGVLDTDDYFYTDEYETNTKSELDTFGFDYTSAIADWDLIKILQTPSSSSTTTTNVVAGEYYLAGDVDFTNSSIRRAIGRDGTIFNASGQTQNIHLSDRGVIWQKSSRAIPNTSCYVGWQLPKTAQYAGSSSAKCTGSSSQAKRQGLTTNQLYIHFTDKWFRGGEGTSTSGSIMPNSRMFTLGEQVMIENTNFSWFAPNDYFGRGYFKITKIELDPNAPSGTTLGAAGYTRYYFEECW